MTRSVCLSHTHDYLTRAADALADRSCRTRRLNGKERTGRTSARLTITSPPTLIVWLSRKSIPSRAAVPARKVTPTLLVGARPARTIRRFPPFPTTTCAGSTPTGDGGVASDRHDHLLEDPGQPSVHVNGAPTTRRATRPGVADFQAQFANNASTGIARNLYWNAGYQDASTTLDVDDGVLAPLTYATVVRDAP